MGKQKSKTVNYPT